MREWRDIHAQLQYGRRRARLARQRAAGRPTSSCTSRCSPGLLGNIGVKSDEDESYLGARGIRFYRHPGAHLSKKPGRWIVAAELVETTRLYARGIAAIEPQLAAAARRPPDQDAAARAALGEEGGARWSRSSARRSTASSIYANRRVDFGNVDPAAAREIFIREALVAGEWETKLPFAAANRKLIAQVEELEHKSRRQDVLVDDELIYAFYDQQLPADVHSGETLRALVPRRGQAPAAAC